MRMLLAVALAGAGSYLLRVVPLLLIDRVRLTERLERRLGYAIQAAMVAFLATMLVDIARTPATASPPPLALGAGVVAGALAAVRTRSMLRITAAGMVVFALTSVLLRWS